MASYQAHSSWKNFWDIREYEATGIEEVKTENGKAQIVYDLTGKRADNPSNGIYIIDGKKVLVK